MRYLGSSPCVWSKLNGRRASVVQINLKPVRLKWRSDVLNAARNIRPRYTPTGLRNLVPTKYGSVITPWCFGLFSPYTPSLARSWNKLYFIATLGFMRLSDSERGRETLTSK